MTLSDRFIETTKTHSEGIFAFALAVAAAVLIKLPAFFGIHLDQDESFYVRNMSLFVLPILTVYFVWKRKLKSRTLIGLAVAFVLAAVFANIYPFESGSDTLVLLALHLPIALWLIVGIAFLGGRWQQVGERMDFVRFSGELFIYYVLIALGGGVLTGFMALIFGTIDIDIEPVFESWLLPCGATGGVIIAAWLVETRENLAANFAPVLARLFSPLFGIMLIIFLGTLLFTENELIMDRNVLITFDLLLVVVLGLLLYSISSRDTETPPGAFDLVQVFLIISALVTDVVALWGITERIAEFGSTPNRVAALGLNFILLVNLTWSAVLYTGFLRGHTSFQALEKWQMDYLPVYVAWTVIIVVIFPPLFGFA